MLTLRPVGHQSTNWMLCLVLMVAVAALTSSETMSPWYNRQQASHVFTMARVTFHHLVGWLRASIGEICFRVHSFQISWGTSFSCNVHKSMLLKL